MSFDNEAGAIVQCKGEKDIIDPGVDGGGAVVLFGKSFCIIIIIIINFLNSR